MRQGCDCSDDMRARTLWPPALAHRLQTQRVSVPWADAARTLPPSPSCVASSPACPPASPACPPLRSCDPAVYFRWSFDAWLAVNASSLGINPWAFDHVVVDMPTMKSCYWWGLGGLGEYGQSRAVGAQGVWVRPAGRMAAQGGLLE